MTFKIKMGKHFVSEGKSFTTTIIEKKFNGYKVINPEGNEAFLCFDDIEIIELSEAEKNLKVTL